MSRNRRNILHSAFTFVRSHEANKATASITLDHVLAQQVQMLKKGETRSIVDAAGNNAGNRPSRYDRLQTLKDDLTKVIKDLQSAKTQEELQGMGIYEVTGGTP